MLAITVRIITALDLILSKINQDGEVPDTRVSELYANKRSSLFDMFPALEGKVPWYPVGDFPTPFEEWEFPTRRAGRFFVKRDDLTSPLFGGHKIRKLEHLLAEAILKDARALVATGRIGSTHALSIALHGQVLGLSVDLSLFDQPITEYVKTNLQGLLSTGVQIRHARSLMGCLLNAFALYTKRKRDGSRPYFIASGATTTLGNIGYVNAGIELALQIRDSGVPGPYTLFIPAGSCGTAAGIVVGLKLANLSARVMAVQTFKPVVPIDVLIRAYANNIVRYLQRQDDSVPELTVTRDDLNVIRGYFGEGYGLPTSAGREAIAWAAPKLKLETTYTGKTLAACLDYCRTQTRDETIIFWNTFNSVPFPGMLPL